MQDVICSNQSMQNAVSSAGRSVADRLKQASRQLPQHQNGLMSGSSDDHDGIVLDGLINSHVPLTAAVSLNELDMNIVRLIGQYLKSRGLHCTTNALVDESGCKLENPAAARFRMHIVNGNWDMVLTDLKALKDFVTQPHGLIEMKFIVLEQKYLELLERGDMMEAVSVLRHDLTELDYKRDRLHELSACMMCRGVDELYCQANWTGSASDGRQTVLDRLQAFLPPTVMLPPKRLELLLRQAWSHQVSRCLMHNIDLDEAFESQALLVDHHCQLSNFPTSTRQILNDHVDEVWCAVFSPCGKYLATGAKESAVHIWRVNSKSRLLEKHKTLDGHASGAAFLAWSNDSTQLAVAGAEDSSPEICIWNVDRAEVKRIVHNQDDSLSVVAWHKCGRRIVCGGQKGQFYQCDIDGNASNPETWEGFRVRGICCKGDGRSVLASDTHHRIRAYTFDDMRDYTVLTESAPLIYFCLDSSERFALVTTKDHGLHLWDIDSRQQVRRYMGSKHGDYVIFSCFGGHKQSFVATGSEDNAVYIWHRDGEQPVKVLRGHTGVVNAVTWNPTDPSMLVSCSDDGTIRLWTSPID